MIGTPYEVRPPAEALATRGFACLGPLLPGHGTDPGELASTHERVYVLGLSMGGLLALA